MAETIFDLVKRSSLSKEQQRELLGFLNFVGNNDVKSLEKLFRTEIDWVKVFYSNIKAKRAAIAQDDMDELFKIMEEEKQIIERMSKEQ